MKKVVALLLIAAMLFTVTACGDTNAASKAEFEQLLVERNVPELLSREEMLNVLQTQVYGKMPPAMEDQYFSVQENTIDNYCGGKAVRHKVFARGTINGKGYGFGFSVVLPTTEGKHPFFVHIKFSGNATDSQQPTEELVDNGFAVLFFNYEAVTSDDSDFTDGLAGVLYEDGVRANDDDPGKIAMWAWAAQRVMDYAETREDVLDLDRAIVCGHSRLGKTALLAAATDERFTFAYSNNSGCSGAALSRGKEGEDLERIHKTASYWFCKNYKQYIGKEETLPLDQHYLLASIAPRKVLVGSASEDKTADPISEQLGCLAASPAFENGFVYTGVAQIGDKFFDGDIAYHLRKGKHAFTRDDWHRLIEFVNLKTEKK